MKKTLLNIICCPTCKGSLTLKIDEEKDDEIQKGTLHCQSCNVTYNITDGIPNLLPKKSSSN
jgi:uncharacterized protein YbaR (Trm112 family)